MADTARSGISSIGFSLIWAWQGKPQSRDRNHQDVKSEGSVRIRCHPERSEGPPNRSQITQSTLCDPPRARGVPHSVRDDRVLRRWALSRGRYENFGPGTSSTGRVLCFNTPLVALPTSKLYMAPWPCVPITIRSALSSSAWFKISSATSPLG